MDQVELIESYGCKYALNLAWTRKCYATSLDRVNKMGVCDGLVFLEDSWALLKCIERMSIIQPGLICPKEEKICWLKCLVWVNQIGGHTGLAFHDENQPCIIVKGIVKVPGSLDLSIASTLQSSLKKSQENVPDSISSWGNRSWNAYQHVASESLYFMILTGLRRLSCRRAYVTLMSLMSACRFERR